MTENIEANRAFYSGFRQSFKEIGKTTDQKRRHEYIHLIRWDRLGGSTIEEAIKQGDFQGVRKLLSVLTGGYE